ncbi:MAG: hypothetical protein ACR2N5_00400 [Solirubrobacterales bacterium]
MSPPVAKPFPRFIADSPQESIPYGDFETRLRQSFLAACEEHVREAGTPPEPDTVRWFPERTWGGRVYLPVTARGVDADDQGVHPEFFGHVSYDRPEDGEPADIRAVSEFTDVTADQNPEWQIDINDDVIGVWRADAGRGGHVTLVWGSPQVRGSIAATAELGDEVVDQSPVREGRFTLIAVDAVSGFGDDLFLEVRLWDRRLNELAAESLYDDPEDLGPDDDEVVAEDDDESDTDPQSGDSGRGS